jgi:hypothetical protein
LEKAQRKMKKKISKENIDNIIADLWPVKDSDGR